MRGKGPVRQRFCARNPGKSMHEEMFTFCGDRDPFSDIQDQHSCHLKMMAGFACPLKRVIEFAKQEMNPPEARTALLRESRQVCCLEDRLSLCIQAQCVQDFPLKQGNSNTWC